MQIADKIGEKYQLINGDVVTYNELCQDEKIRLYQKEHNVDLQTATITILQVEEECEQEETREEYAARDDMAEDGEGNFTKLEGIEEDAEIQAYMQKNNVDYQEAYMQIASTKTEEGESGRFCGESDGEFTKLKDNDSGKVIKLSNESIKTYQQKHDCSYERAEREIFSKAINRLKEVC